MIVEGGCPRLKTGLFAGSGRPFVTCYITSRTARNTDQLLASVPPSAAGAIRPRGRVTGRCACGSGVRRACGRRGAAGRGCGRGWRRWDVARFGVAARCRGAWRGVRAEGEGAWRGDAARGCGSGGPAKCAHCHSQGSRHRGAWPREPQPSQQALRTRPDGLSHDDHGIGGAGATAKP
jgi:hypothetical protein